MIKDLQLQVQKASKNIQNEMCHLNSLRHHCRVLNAVPQLNPDYKGALCRSQSIGPPTVYDDLNKKQAAVSEVDAALDFDVKNFILSDHLTVYEIKSAEKYKQALINNPWWPQTLRFFC